MKINIETIPISEMRYATCGDYWTDENGTLQVRIAETGDEDYNQAIVLHELWERFLLKCTEKEVDAFDMNFEIMRINFDEPGDEPSAPYVNEHCSATGIERIFIALKNKSWKKYENLINNL